jgi:hypothetical protein
MQRLTGKPETTPETSNISAKRQHKRAARADAQRPQPQAERSAAGAPVNEEAYVMTAEDNADAWAHQLDLEQEQQAVEQRQMQPAMPNNPRPDNYFTKLASIDVSEHIEKKGEFSYLSWAWAIDRLRKAHPDATWEVKRFDGVPYLKTECGYFVEVAVSVAGVTLSQIHPVLDGRNRPIKEPNAFDINTSIQRCLVKAIALHGLGLYVYAGEDLPEGTAPATISQEQQARLHKMIDEVGADTAKFLEYFKIGQLAELPAADYRRAVGALEKKRKTA